MNTPYIVTKSPKSVGIAILLTLLFGPIGLFYATVTGGFVMTFGPILLSVFLIFGDAIQSTFIAGLTLTLFLIFIGAYWLITIVWAVSSVRSYNREIEYEAQRRIEAWSSMQHNQQSQFSPGVRIESTQQSLTVNPKLHEWLQQNPDKGINDYYAEFGKL